MTDELVMVAKDGFYFIEAAPGVPLKTQAEDNGLLNPHVERVETLTGEILWSRQ